MTPFSGTVTHCVLQSKVHSNHWAKAARKKERQNMSQSNPRNASGGCPAAVAGAARDGMVHSLRGFRPHLKLDCECK
jgi:hypothetical protein